MSGGFSNPLVGGGGALVYPSIHSPGFVTGSNGWTINKDGSAEFNNVIIRNGQIVSGTSLYYSGAPAANTLSKSIAVAGGTDPFGNVYLPGFSNYFLQGGTWFASTFTSAVVAFFSGGATEAGPWTQIGTMQADNISMELIHSAFIELNSPLIVADGEIDGTSAFFLTNKGTGQVLTVQNGTGNPSQSNLQIISQLGGDNSFGIMVNGDTNNRIKFLTNGMLLGPGNATQDTRFTRDSPNTFISDNILTNLSGSAETWHSLGTLAGATVNIGRYRFLPTGFVHVQIDVTFGGSTAVPITFSNTLPVAYRPLASDVDVRSAMSQTNGAGGVARIFIGQAGGANPGAVQLAALSNVIGTYSCNVQYPVI